MLKTDSGRHSKRFPYWLRQSVGFDPAAKETNKTLADLCVETVCQSARCPNIYDCFSRKRCTFLILGNYCTRSCRFCAIETRKDLLLPDKKELFNIREAVEGLGARRAIITSVTRDDLNDGGAGHFADCIEILRDLDVALEIEVLVPDFLGRHNSIEKVLSAGPDIFSHNIETVPRLYNRVRPQADYQRSLDVIQYTRKLNPRLITKSGLMAGLGEHRDEVYSVMEDLKEAGCDIIKIGQYLRPDSRCLKVEEFLHPVEFERFSEWARELGFKQFSCSPFTRSSYIKGGIMAELKLPELAKGVNEAVVSFWHFKEGDAIKEGDEVVEMATDKAAFNVPSKASGVLKKIAAEEGDTVKVGGVLAVIE